ILMFFNLKLVSILSICFVYNYNYLHCFLLHRPMICYIFLQEGEKFCSEEEVNGQIWPKAPSGDTVINRTCPEGRVGCVVKSSDGNRTRCECNHLTSFSVLMAKSDISTEILDMITYVGLGVSVCSLLIFLIIESLVWSAVVKTNLSHFRHTAIVNIAVFLLLADCCFLASSFPETISESTCLVLTICKHLFFLAMFSWMLCMSVMLVHQLIFVFSPLRKRVFMFLSSIVGYLCPILIVGCSYLYSKYTDKPYHNKDTCWLIFERVLEGSVHAFLLPVGTVILTNVFSMVVVIVTLMKSSVPDGKSDEKETIKSIIKVVVFLTPVFGVTWVIGFFLLILDGDDPMFHVANYSFTILNSFQLSSNTAPEVAVGLQEIHSARYQFVFVQYEKTAPERCCYFMSYTCA
uniref:Adhesion G protein-coupled receptor F3b n=1 Tax=Seriola dumerili TaxID=41447 RepID=A0A3B4TZW3_SERDU